MNFKLAVIALIASAWTLPVQAAELTSGTTTPATANTPMTTNTTTLTASALISPGRYTASVAPFINSDMGTRLEKAVGRVPGIHNVVSDAKDSSIHFTVKNGASVRVADIEKAVAKAEAGAVVSAPILEHSMTPNPGL